MDEVRQRMAEIRATSQGDVETMLLGLRKNLDWRYHLNRHPWAFAGAAAILGYWLIPKGRIKAKLDSATLKQMASEFHLPEFQPEKQDFLHKWVIPMALKWGSSGAMQIGQLLLTKAMAKSAVKEAAVEDEETAFSPPHRPR